MCNYLIEEVNTAKSLLEKFCDTHRRKKNNNIFSAYTALSRTNIFNSTITAELLFTIEDETYNYLAEKDINIFCEDRKYNILFNIFSGSGRLVKQLERYGILRKFQMVYNIDKSEEMIEFEKKVLTYNNVKFICKNFLDIEPKSYKCSLAICHCGIRYIDVDKYDVFLKKLLMMKENTFAKCIITEISSEIIRELIRILNFEKIEFTYIRRTYKMQRNTTLYLSLKYYHDNNNFRKLIDDISTKSERDRGDILQEISGFKVSDMHIITF